MERKRQFRVVAQDGQLINSKSKKKNITSKNETIHIPFIKFALILVFALLTIKAISGGFKNSPLLSDTEEITQVATIEDNIAATTNVITYSKDVLYTSSGVILSTTSNSGIVILTAKHGVVIGQNSYTEVTFVDGHTYQVDHIYYNKDSDYAILTIDLNKIDSNTLKVIKTVKYDSNVRYSTGDKIYCIGQHNTDGLLFYEGEINSSNINSFLGKLDDSLYELTANMECRQGTSGGGIYNEQGVILGICVSGTEEYTRFLPIYEILDSCSSNDYL